MRRPALKILSYHSIIAETRGDKWRVPVARFRAQMQWLVDRAIPVLPLLEAVRRLADGTHPSRAVALTFDDGHLDNHTHVLPVLLSLGLPATLFVLAQEMSQDRAGWESPRMTWGQVKEWVEAGLSVGVHGMCHVELPPLDTAGLRAELVTARRMIADRLGREPSPAFAYPYGLATRRVREAARAARYACAVSGSDPRACTARTDPFSLHRETIYGDTARWGFAAKVDSRWDGPRLIWDAPARRAIRLARRLVSSPLASAACGCEP